MRVDWRGRIALLGVVAALAVAPVANAATPQEGLRASAPTTGELVHRLFVVPFAGRRPYHASSAAAAYNLQHYGVRTPAQVVRDFQPGGVILFSDNVSTVAQVTRLTRELQRVARRQGYPLLVMTDQEGGRVSRLPGAAASSQPSAASYDGDAAAARRDARVVGTAMRRMGVLVDLAPVADVNTVGDAGVIGDRSFGSTPDLVSRMVHAQVCGYHAGGVATTLKHWPGHGSTSVDSHQALPTLTLPVSRWRRIHLPPFRAGISTGADLVMVGHLAYPALDPSGRPASLSPVLTRHWLRDRIGFGGVVITDALTMGALRAFGDSARLSLRAFRAGADLLLMPGAPRLAAHGLTEAVRQGRVSIDRVRTSIHRIGSLADELGLEPGPGELPTC